MNGFKTFGRLLAYSPLLLAAAAAWAQQDVTAGTNTIVAAPTAAEAEAAFRSAREGLLAVASGSADVSVSAITTSATTVEDRVAGGEPRNVSLEKIQVVLDVTDVTLRDVMTQIVQQAATYTGPWTVKWRLSPENAGVMTERVNLTAEADFGAFCDLLVERVKNMTGTQLFVTAFAGTRVLLVTDTYY